MQDQSAEELETQEQRFAWSQERLVPEDPGDQLECGHGKKLSPAETY